MPRSRNSVPGHRRHRKVLRAARGYRGARSRTFRSARTALLRAGNYAYRDRRQRKRQFRSLWVARINAAARGHELPYSRFMNGLRKAQIELDRRVLAELAVNDKAAFASLVATAKAALG